MGTKSTETTVYLADDDISVRSDLSQRISFIGHKVEAYASADDLMRYAALTHPACLMLDIRLPDINCPLLVDKLKQRVESLPIVFLTENGDIPIVVEAMCNGPVGFLAKPFSDTELSTMLKAAISCGRDRQRLRKERQQIQNHVATLTNRERETLEYVIAGLRNKVIAEHMKLSEKTVKVYRGKMMMSAVTQSVPPVVESKCATPWGRRVVIF